MNKQYVEGVQKRIKMVRIFAYLIKMDCKCTHTSWLYYSMAKDTVYTVLRTETKKNKTVM